MNNILKNKNQLNDYLEDFHIDKKNEILKLFDNFNFDCGITSFRGKMKLLIGMPKYGKRTIIYWTSRGWDEETAKIKRTPTIKNVEDSPMNINFWLKRGFSLEESEYKIKSQRKMNKEYWLDRGFSMEESITKSNEFQKNNNKIFTEKLKNDLNFRKSFLIKTNTTLDYWMNKGLSEEESISKLSERQSTFSMEKCISKYGDTEGRRIWEERQEKWQKSLKESEYNGSDNKDSRSIDFFKKRYGDDWIIYYIDKTTFKNKEEIKYLITFENYKEMILKLISCEEKLSNISNKLKYPIISEVYNTNPEQMYSFLIENYENDYGRPSYYERIYGDKWIGEFIKSNTYKNVDELYFLLSFENHFKLIDYLVNNYSMTNIILILKRIIISYFYKKTYEEMYEYLTSINPNIKSKFGYMRYYNNHLCRSNGEFIISKFLKERNIEYVYEKNYPESNKRCDFYLVDKDLYVEYTGMSTVKKYNDKYDIKKLFCLENKIKHLFSNDIEYIQNEIIKIYGI